MHRQIENKDVHLPVNWKQFVDLPENKQDLDNFLRIELIDRAKSSLQGSEIVTSGGLHERTAAESSLGTDVSSLKSNHDEADTRIVLHAKMLAMQGFQRTCPFKTY